MLLKKLAKQYRVPEIGIFKETLAQALWWGVPLNFAMMAGTFYYTTVRHVASWVNPWMFFIIFGVGIAVILILDYKFALAALWSFREKQMFSHKSEVMDELGKLKKRSAAGQRRLMLRLKGVEKLIEAIAAQKKEEKK